MSTARPWTSRWNTGIPCGGWCPKGRRAEDGSICPCYPVTETPSVDYAQRTEWNVRDADGTLILTRGPATGATAFTIEVARRLGKPCLSSTSAGRRFPQRSVHGPTSTE